MPIVVVLPVPLTPTAMITVGVVAQVDAVVAGARDVGEQLDSRAAERLAALEPPLVGLLLELADDLGGRASRRRRP